MKRQSECFICNLPIETQEQRLCPQCQHIEDLLPKAVLTFDAFVNRLILFRVTNYETRKPNQHVPPQVQSRQH